MVPLRTETQLASEFEKMNLGFRNLRNKKLWEDCKKFNFSLVFLSALPVVHNDIYICVCMNSCAAPSLSFLLTEHLCICIRLQFNHFNRISMPQFISPLHYPSPFPPFGCYSLQSSSSSPSFPFPPTYPHSPSPSPPFSLGLPTPKQSPQPATCNWNIPLSDSHCLRQGDAHLENIAQSQNRHTDRPTDWLQCKSNIHQSLRTLSPKMNRYRIFGNKIILEGNFIEQFLLENDIGPKA